MQAESHSTFLSGRPKFLKLKKKQLQNTLPNKSHTIMLVYNTEKMTIFIPV